MERINCAIITGASSGFGKEFVSLLIEDTSFDRIFVLARNEEKLNDLRNNSIQNKMSEYDELICELDEQKKEYVGLIHDVKKLKMQLQSELLKIM